MSEITTIGRFCAKRSGAGKCWASSAAIPAVWSGWKRVRRPITGLARGISSSSRNQS
jgi:hypothetical protein